MIKGKILERVYIDKPVVDYRALPSLNSSMLKVFDENPVKFYKIFKLGEKEKDKESVSKTIGSIVDFYILECNGDDDTFQHRFDEKFALFNGVKGSGQVFLLADYLFEETEKATNDKGEVIISFEERFKDAYNRIKAEDKYKGEKNTLEKVLEDFEKNGKEYYEMKCESFGKQVVEVSLVDKSKVVAINLLTDPFTADIFHPEDNKENYNHFVIEFDYPLTEGRRISCKVELDALQIDHEEKTIQLFDLKTNYDNEEWMYTYLKYKSYIQAAFYYQAVKVWAEREGLRGYTIKPMKFVVGDTSMNNRRPLVYSTSYDDLKKGLYGFTYKGQKYRGVEELLYDIAWAEESNLWNCSREAYDNNGQMTLKINYE